MNLLPNQGRPSNGVSKLCTVIAEEEPGQRVEDEAEPDEHDDRGEDRRVRERPHHDALDDDAAEERDDDRDARTRGQ